jgi:tight adherence protein C
MAVLIATVATFLSVLALVLSGYRALTAEAPTARRLRTLLPDAVPPRRARGPAAKGPGAGQRLLAGVGRLGIGGSERSIAQKLSYAGFRASNAALLFLGARTLVSLGPALLVLVPQVSAGRPLGRACVLAGLVWLAGHTLANAWLAGRARRRIRRLAEALPDTLDLMVVCLESGLGLAATITRIGEERAAVDDPLGREFARVAVELREGRPRDEALRALSERNGVDDLKALCGLVIQSDKLGASMTKTLRAHADVLRSKRRQRAEEIARKLPIKMLVPLALFILPPLLVMAAGPALLAIKNLSRVIARG